MRLKICIRTLKHLFCISSPLAFSICDYLIKIDGMKVSDCVFLTTRTFKLPSDKSLYQVFETDLNASERSGRLFAGWRVIQTRRNVREFDKLIARLTDNQEYIFYTQVCYNDISNVAITNPRCRGYYIMEDGSGSYSKEDICAFRGWRAGVVKYILKPLFPRIFTIKEKMIETNHPKFKGCIATNDQCFPNHRDALRVIGLPFHPESLPFAPQAMISLDPYYKWLTDEQVEQVLQQLGNYINKKHYSHIVYKPHPYLLIAENKERYNLYNNWLRKYVQGDLEELTPNVSLENTLMAHRDCDFYTAVSSVAIYAKAMGVQCYTFAPLIRQYCNLTVPVVEDLCIPIIPE